MTASLQQSHLREAGLPVHLATHLFLAGGSLSESLVGTTVDEIMKLGGWETASVAAHCTSPALPRKAKRRKLLLEQSYMYVDNAAADKFAL